MPLAPLNMLSGPTRIRDHTWSLRPELKSLVPMPVPMSFTLGRSNADTELCVLQVCAQGRWSSCAHHKWLMTPLSTSVDTGSRDVRRPERGDG